MTADPPGVLSFGDNVTFTCSALGGPDNMFQWLEDGQDLLSESQSTLTLTTVNAMDGGVYTCVVNNTAGSDRSNITLYIQPYIVMEPETEIRTIVGGSVTFNCEAMSFPTPNYLWEKLDDPSFVSLDQVLSFDNVTFGQEGSYRCVAYVTVGMVNYTAVSDTGVLTSKSFVLCSLCFHLFQHLNGISFRIMYIIYIYVPICFESLPSCTIQYTSIYYRTFITSSFIHTFQYPLRAVFLLHPPPPMCLWEAMKHSHAVVWEILVICSHGYDCMMVRLWGICPC